MSGARARLRRIGWILGLGIAISAAVLLGVTGASSTGSEGGVVLEVLEASVSDGRLKAAVSVTNNDSQLIVNLTYTVVRTNERVTEQFEL